MDVSELVLPGGGTLRLSLTNATPESLKNTAELFEVIDSLTKKGDQTEAVIEINDPQEDCPFLQELRNASPKQENS